MKYIVLIPAYNPDDNLIKLLGSIDKSCDIIVVNDGSNKKCDKIFSLVFEYGHLISYKKNHGKGYALKCGLKYIKENYKEYTVVCMDCDMQHTFNDALKLLEYASNHKDVLVLGKRNFDNKVPFKSKLGNSIIRKIYKKATGKYIYDTQTGLRAFSNELTNYMLDQNGNRFEYEMNVLLNVNKEDIKIHEIEIETIYIDNNKKSTYNVIKDSYRIYKEVKKWSRDNEK